MLTTKAFIEKYNSNTLTTDDIKNIPFDFSLETDSLNWLPIENNEKEFIFYLKETNKIYLKDKIKLEIKEIDYKF